MTDKAREEFEAAVLKMHIDTEVPEHDARCFLERQSSGIYSSIHIKAAWWAWQASRAALVAESDPIAWRGCNAYGEVVTDWIEGAGPGRMVDLCGNPASYDKIEYAYSRPLEVEIPSVYEFSASDNSGYVLERCREMLEAQCLKVKP